MAYAAVLVGLFSLVACGDDDRPPPGDGGTGADAPTPPIDAPMDSNRERAPFFRTPVGLDNTALAFEAMRLLGSPEAGATETYCNDCHPLTRETIQSWSALTDDTMTNCLNQLLVPTDQSAIDMIACTRGPGGNYSAAALGIVSTAVDLEWFRYVFRHGTPGADWMTEHARFADQAGMPPTGGHPRLTQAEFDVVMEWFRRGIPSLNAVLGGPPPLGDCEPSVGPEVAPHLAEMATMGWRVANRDASLLMYGCAGAATVRDCLATETLASGTTYGATWDVIPGTALRVLYTTDFSSSFWTRSSADGRFVGQGGGRLGGATVIDLALDRAIPVDAAYDPAFFPDNSGFIFHGGGAQFCEQSVLVGASSINFSEPGCTTPGGVGLYEHIGTSLGGGDYWAVSGEFVSDDGGHGATFGDPSASFSPGSTLTLTLMLNDGSGFRTANSVAIDTPDEGDTAISPSSRLLVSRAAGTEGQEGFVLRLLDATVSGGRVTAASAPVVGRYCYNGGKPGWSYDDRWLVLHHYIDGNDAVDLGFTGPGDPGFSGYLSQGAANVYLIDLTDGTRTRITNMRPGQYALFPHFRSDGWIYFIVRGDPGGEHIVASDAALEIE